MKSMDKPMRFCLFFCFCLILGANEICYNLENSYILAQDERNTFLGKIENSFSKDSIFNEFGNFGSEYSTTSIFNEFGDFGSEFGIYSATNSFSNTPPMIIKNGRIIGFITTNKMISGGISPSLLKALCKDFF